MIELKNRLSLPILAPSSDGPGANTATSDVREALIGLGYSDAEIREALRDLPSSADAATMWREAFGSLGARRA